jgi:2,3,4,5-tetrahydropyridine-2-carboxylate N-succinyltransferase
MVTQGARVGDGAVLGEGTIVNPSIPVIDAETGAEISRGIVPPWCVAIGAARRREYPGGEFFVPCVLDIKRLDPGRRHDKAQLEAVLRDHQLSA